MEPIDHRVDDGLKVGGFIFCLIMDFGPEGGQDEGDGEEEEEGESILPHSMRRRGGLEGSGVVVRGLDMEYTSSSRSSSSSTSNKISGGRANE